MSEAPLCNDAVDVFVAGDGGGDCSPAAENNTNTDNIHSSNTDSVVAAFPPVADEDSAATVTVEQEGGERNTCDSYNIRANVESSEEATSLLDSCHSDDEEDEDHPKVQDGSPKDNASPILEETGRPRSPRMGRNEGSDSKAPAPTIESNNPEHHTLSPTSTTKVSPPRRDGLAFDFKSPTSTTKLSAPRLDGLAFDLNQPWERSLLRQLDQTIASNAAAAAAVAANGDAGTKFLPSINPSPPRRELVLLGHTESRDYAMDYSFDDAISLDTNASSIILPSRAQLIHRTALNTDPQPRMAAGYYPATHDLPGTEEIGTPPPNNDPTTKVMKTDGTNNIDTSMLDLAHPPQHDVCAESRRAASTRYDHSATSSLTSFTTLGNHDDERDDDEVPPKVPPSSSTQQSLKRGIPDRLPGRKTTSNSLLAAAVAGEKLNQNPTLYYRNKNNSQSNFLEMEASVHTEAELGNQGDDEEEHGDYNNNGYDGEYVADMATAAAKSMMPDPGCFCLGINMMDYVLPPTPTSNNAMLRNRQGGRSRFTNNGIFMRPMYPMPRVHEEEDRLPEMIELSRNKEIRHNRDHDRNKQQQQNKERMKQSQQQLRKKASRATSQKKSEPEGIYQGSGTDGPFSLPNSPRRRKVVDV